MSKKITAMAFAFVAFMDKAGDVLVAIDAAEKYATMIVKPIIEKVETLPIPAYGLRFGQNLHESLSRCYRAMLGLITDWRGMARCA